MESKESLRRALLYVPASPEKMLQKSHQFNVDCAVYDLEDSVAEDLKSSARKGLREFLDGPRPENIKEIAVRINSVDTQHALEDLTTVLPAKHIDAVVVPKVQSAEDVHFVQGILRHVLPDRHPLDGVSKDGLQAPIKILPLIESAKGLFNISAIVSASPYIDAIVFAAEDFTLDMGITRTKGLPELLYARSKIVLTAKTFGISSILDLVCTKYKDSQGQEQLKEESLAGKNLGFTGKQCIHPTQVEVVQNTFAPSTDEVEWATRVVVANEKANAQGRGAWSLDGQMVDVPVVERAKRTVDKAEQCGLNISNIRAKFSSQEPE